MCAPISLQARVEIIPKNRHGTLILLKYENHPKLQEILMKAQQKALDYMEIEFKKLLR